MDSDLLLKLMTAGILLFFIVKMIPAAKHHLASDNKGSASEWLNAGLLLAGVVLFVVFLMSIS